jgi:protoporphyrinogen/coproporphyrinogen III oxidase
VTRRFGREVLQRVVEPLMVGIYGAEAERLSVAASMPQLAALERNHGSIAWGMFRTRAQRAAAAAASSDPMVVSLRGGMTQLTDRLAACVSSSLRLGVSVQRIERGAGRRYRLQLEGDSLEADAVIMAAPAYAAAELVEALDSDLARALAAVPHGSLLCASFAFRRADIPHPMDGTGFIVPATERRATSACSFMCRKWPGRAPEGHSLIRSFLRGLPADTSEEVLSAQALLDLRDLMGITATPLWSRVRRRARSLPRYEVGHAARVQAMMDRAKDLGAFALAGNAYYGVGIGECLHSGQLAAKSVSDALA